MWIQVIGAAKSMHMEPMDRWRQRRDRLFASDWLTDEQKREILFKMIEERDQVLDGVTDVKAGMKGLSAYNWERTMV